MDEGGGGPVGSHKDVGRPRSDRIGVGCRPVDGPHVLTTQHFTCSETEHESNRKVGFLARFLAASLAVMASLASAADQARPDVKGGIPHLRKQGTATQLIVQGEPFIILGGELHNSSASSLAYMEPIWAKLAAMNLNTVLATVSWELLEPEEGKFDFTLVDGLIEGAGKHKRRLVFLWFGSWKNGVSSYVPGWVKTDVKRFPRVQRRDGAKGEVLTPLGDANCEADAKAFAALMRHIRQMDGREQTVVMVQVENEVGLLGDARDRSPLAEKAFAQPVPAELLDYLAKHKDSLIPEFRQYWEATDFKSSGTWSEVFGDGADETFMAWHYARYIGKIVADGKAQHPLPMFVNAWLIQREGQKPGAYPSGGPVSKMIDVWRAGGPAIDLFAPDIYLSDFQGVCASYTRSGNPLFIPEAGRGPDAAAKALVAIGQFDAIGFCPFGIDSMSAENPLKDTYQMLADLMPAMAQAQGSGKMIVLADQGEGNRTIDLAGYRLEVSPGGGGRGGSDGSPAIVIASGAEEFLVAGAGLGIHFSARTRGPRQTGILAIDEGRFQEGKWVPGRRMNGDENAGGWKLQLPGGAPSIQRIRLYQYD